MNVKQSRLRRNDSTMIKIDNMDFSENDALEPYRAISHISKNPKILYDQSTYKNEKIEKNKKVSMLVICAYVIAMIAIILTLVLIVKKLF